LIDDLRDFWMGESSALLERDFVQVNLNT
jgi:hypothetical protein